MKKNSEMNSNPYTALSWYVWKEFGKTAVLERWRPHCSAGVMTYLGIDPIKRVTQRALVCAGEETFYCVWDFPDCPDHHCEVVCSCMECEGTGAWGEYGPCSCIAWARPFGVIRENPDPWDERYNYFKVPIAEIWPQLDDRERVDVYEVNPCFVYEVMPNAHEWYFPARNLINEIDGKNGSKIAKRIRREKEG